VNYLEQAVRELTAEINGQFPRPWMTTMTDPAAADVFIVGLNPAKAYPSSAVSHQRHIDALFNRNGESCRGLYAEVTQESPTRGNIDLLSAKLSAAGVCSVLETNVICYSTADSKALRLPEHAGGKERGRAIFSMLTTVIRPKAMVIHGAGVRKEFGKVFNVNLDLLPLPTHAAEFFHYDLATGTRVFLIPSLALPAYRTQPPGNSFCNWADDYLSKLAALIAAHCSSKN
jgi:hypothetical protein